jgi:hypothetical protein
MLHDIVGHDVFPPVLMADFVGRDPLPPGLLAFGFFRVECFLAVDDYNPGSERISTPGLSSPGDDVQGSVRIDPQPFLVEGDNIHRGAQAEKRAVLPLFRKYGRDPDSFGLALLHFHRAEEIKPEAGGHAVVFIISGRGVEAAAHRQEIPLRNVQLDLEGVADRNSFPPEQRMP